MASNTLAHVTEESGNVSGQNLVDDEVIGAKASTPPAYMQENSPVVFGRFRKHDGTHITLWME